MPSDQPDRCNGWWHIYNVDYNQAISEVKIIQIRKTYIFMKYEKKLSVKFYHMV